MSNDDLTPREKEALEKLPKERMPSADLEERLVKSLRAEGVLKRSRRPVVELTLPRALAAVAASLLLVIGGFALGRWSEPQQTQIEDTTNVESSDISVAASLQRAGSAYVLALENFTAMPEGTADEDELRQGREVAIKTLSTATDKVAKFVPKRYLAGQLLDVISAGGGTASQDTTNTGDPNVFWF